MRVVLRSPGRAGRAPGPDDLRAGPSQRGARGRGNGQRHARGLVLTAPICPLWVCLEPREAQEGRVGVLLALLLVSWRTEAAPVSP
jgi:hypothetical protein